MAESRDDKSDAVQRLLRDPLNSNDLMAWRTLAFALQEQLQSARSAAVRSEWPISRFQLGVILERLGAAPSLVEALDAEIDRRANLTPSHGGAIDLSSYINAADISASDAPHVVIYKLQQVINSRMPSHVERRFQICKDHENAEWNQTTLDGDDCILCRLFYLEAQESLLEEWQQRTLRAEGAIAEIQRPLDAQMARLNATVVRLNEENERLRSAPSATGSAEWAEDARPWEMRDGDVTFLWMDDGIEVVAMSHGKRWRTVLPLPVRRTESRIKEKP